MRCFLAALSGNTTSSRYHPIVVPNQLRFIWLNFQQRAHFTVGFFVRGINRWMMRTDLVDQRILILIRASRIHSLRTSNLFQGKRKRCTAVIDAADKIPLWAR